jgi:4-carboxymuconolactone decarboxylase
VSTPAAPSDPPPTLHLARLCVAIAAGRFDEVRRLRREAPPGGPDRSWREAVLQTHLFAGFPAVVEALGVLEEEGGLGEPGPDEAAPEPDLPDRGRGLFERIYGARAAGLEAHLAGRHPQLAIWVLGHAYGRVLTRPGLDAATRELLAVCCLARTGPERQLAGHVRGAQRCGASPEDLREALRHVADLLEPGSLERALRLVGALH